MVAVVFVNIGYLSYMNGARGAGKTFFDLAKLLETEAITGMAYGDDRLEVDLEMLPLVEELLTEHKVLYYVVGRDKQWINIQTDVVRDRVFGKSPRVA